jgi:hypothetical protein
VAFRSVDYLQAGGDSGRVAFQQINTMLEELYGSLPSLPLAESALAQDEATVASAATTDIGAAGKLRVQITGTATITSLGTTASKLRWVRFAATLTLTHNATSLILPGGANITTAAGDAALFASDGSGNWRCHAYQIAADEPQRVRTKRITLSRDLSLASGSVGYTGVGFKPTAIVFIGAQTTAGGYTGVAVVDSAGAFGGIAANQGFTGFVSNATLIAGTTTTGQTATLSSFDTDGFTLAWTKNGAPTGTVVYYALCFR